MYDIDRLLNEIDQAKDFAKKSGMINSEKDPDYLQTVQARLLELFWKQSTQLLYSDLDLEVKHLVLQDTVQMAKILKDWSLGDKTLDMKNKVGVKDMSAAEVIDKILDEAKNKFKKDKLYPVLPLDKIGEIEELNKTN